MAVFKCKMCGGDLDVVDGMSVAECEYCGTKQTLPKLNDNEKEIMYDRAGHFRRNNEFDKAMGIYEKILDIDNTDAEAYWSLVLCEYGIEYVEDPSTHKRVPTVNRAQFTSVFMNENYKSAIQYADAYQRSIYEEEAKNIDNIQKGILEISQNEEPFDVFICYKETDEHGRRTHDSVLANDLYHQLTQEGFKVFFSRITLEDKLGTAYEPYIFAALNSAKVMVVIGTKPEYFNAVWVKNEWVRFLAQIKNGVDKILIPAYKDMDPYDLPEEFSNLQAQDMSKLGFMQDLIRGVKKITQKDKKENVVIQVADKGHNDAENMVKRAYIALEDGDFKSANDFAEKALDKDAENAQAYIIQLLVELSLRKEADLEKHNIPLENYKKYIRAYGFAQSEYKDLLSKYNKGSFEVYFNETEKKIDITKSSEDLKKILQELDEFSESDRKSALVNKINQKIQDITNKQENIDKNIDELKKSAENVFCNLREKYRKDGDLKGCGIYIVFVIIGIIIGIIALCSISDIGGYAFLILLIAVAIIVFFLKKGLKQTNDLNDIYVGYDDGIKILKDGVYGVLGTTKEDDYLSTIIDKNARTIVKIPAKGGKGDYLWQISSDIVDSKRKLVMLGKLFTSNIEESTPVSSENGVKAAWKNSIAKKTLCDRICKEVINAEFLQCVVDVDIPTEKEYIETRGKYKTIFPLDFWLKPEADSKRVDKFKCVEANEIKSMEITLISSIVPQITVDIEKVKELSKKHA